MRPDNRIIFPYKIHKGTASPIIPVEINGIFVDAFVDSGAFCSIFSDKEADALGIDCKRVKPTFAIVGDGSFIPVYYHALTVAIGNVSFKATIGFSPRLGVGFNLLGRKDFFSRFKVLFDDVKHSVTFIPNKR